jgi:hypothetical protein
VLFKDHHWNWSGALVYLYPGTQTKVKSPTPIAPNHTGTWGALQNLDGKL